MPAGRDVGRVWDLAVQLRRALAASGPRVVNAGTADEPRWVDRGEAMVAFHARRLLVELDADPARLAAVGVECRRREQRARRRLPRPAALGAPRPAARSRWWRWDDWVSSRADRAHTWSAAARVSKTAAFWAARAGDDDGRARLLGAQRGLLHHDRMGAWLPAVVDEQQAGPVVCRSGGDAAGRAPAGTRVRGRAGPG